MKLPRLPEIAAIMLASLLAMVSLLAWARAIDDMRQRAAGAAESIEAVKEAQSGWRTRYATWDELREGKR